MLNLSQEFLCGLALLVSAATASASTAPVDGDLLRLVPGGAQIVAGISDPGTSSSTGRLLVVTVNNNRDYDTGDLSDHLLLVAGHFDRFEIFKAALENGSTRAEYNGEQVLVVKPFDREKNSMNAVRWLAILKNRVLVFGVPGMVARTLDRYERNEPADAILLQRIARLPPDVNSWSVMAMPPQMLTAHLALDRVPASLETILKDADEVELGIHYGRMTRVSFSIHTPAGDFNGGLLSRAQPILASFIPNPHSRLKIGMDEQSRLHGWMTVPEKQFDQWLAALAASRSGSRGSRGGERQ